MKTYTDKVEFDVRWLPFQLNPKAPGGEGVNKMQMYKEKFGPAKAESIIPMMVATGKKEGINFSYGGNVGNTYDSHRLINFAAKQGKQDEIVEELFHNYFEEEKCLSDRSILLAAAQKVGLTGAQEMLERGGEAAEVDADLRKYQGGGINGVPHFIVDGRYHESGAIEPTAFRRIFEECLRQK
mmetsp:Transcript_48588/g.112601  ORF Transcript_48588/g.112601 Transcript_48588/m.112601 type:complete len:183 (+) Transcript_48588:83-631(+)